MLNRRERSELCAQHPDGRGKKAAARRQTGSKFKVQRWTFEVRSLFTRADLRTIQELLGHNEVSSLWTHPRNHRRLNQTDAESRGASWESRRTLTGPSPDTHRTLTVDNFALQDVSQD